jgi:hypothetical protein
MFSRAVFFLLFTKAVLVFSQQCQNVGNLQVFYDPTCANGIAIKIIELIH